MSSFTIPPLLNPDGSLTAAGQALVKYANATVNQQRRDNIFDTYKGERYRAWFAATMTAKAVMSPEQFIAAYYAKDREPDSISAMWLDYLGTLTPEQRARAQVIPPTESTKESYNMDTQTINLSESLRELADIINEQPDTAPAQESHITLQEALTSPAALRRFVHQENMNAVKAVLDRVVSPGGAPLWGKVRSADEFTILMNYLKAGK